MHMSIKLGQYSQRNHSYWQLSTQQQSNICSCCSLGTILECLTREEQVVGPSRESSTVHYWSAASSVAIIENLEPTLQNKSSTRTQPLSCPPSTPSRTAHTQTAKMSAQQISIDNADLEKLNDNDRNELRQFLANEQQRSQIQARMFTRDLK